MADGITSNFNFILPEIGLSKATWGGKLNDNWEALDAILGNSGTTGTFLRRAGGTMTGSLTVQGQVTAQMVNVTGEPAEGNDATNKAYVDTLVNNAIASRLTQAQGDARYLRTTGGSVTGNLDFDRVATITNLPTPTGPYQPAIKEYVDEAIATRLTQAAADGRYTRRTQEVVGGEGMFGGGALDGTTRTITLGMPSTINHTTGNTRSTNSHTHELSFGSVPYLSSDPDAPRLLVLDGASIHSRIGPGDFHRLFNTTPAGRYIVAGNGLLGGGNFEDNRSFALGTPGTITADSANEATATSHTHAITWAEIGKLIARFTLGAVGDYAMLRYEGGTSLNAGATSAGSNLRWSSADGDINGGPSGTWKLQGNISAGGGVASRTALWKRTL